MDRTLKRPVIPLVLVCLISLFMVTQTAGYENIRAVQFLLIFAGGMCGGVALGYIRASRKAQIENPPKM